MPGKLRSISSIGLLGFGAFGRLVAEHLQRHVPLYVFDPAWPVIEAAVAGRIVAADVASVAGCDLIILAVPVGAIADAICAIRPHLRPGTIVLDVGSVKLMPARLMQAGLPDHVEIIGTHPLFGPQSARRGIKGLKIALCPIRGGSTHRIAAFLRRALGLRVFITTAEAHDREAALAQGLTHLIAKVLVQMGPLPARLTTVSFDLLAEAIEMVRHDPPSVFLAIERDNPHAAPVRERFFAIAEEVRRSLETHQHLPCDDGAGRG
jgi:prephenate dehydrogenase